MLTKTEFSLKLDEDLEDLRRIKGRCFSDEEYQKRWQKVITYLEDTKLDSLIIYGAERAGSAIPWLTGWPVSAEALLIISLDSEAKLFVQYYNHTPQAKSTAYGASVSWGGPNTAQTMLNHLNQIKARKVGLIGKMSFEMMTSITEAGYLLTPLDSWYEKTRLIKTNAEIKCLKIGAYFSDLAVKSIYEKIEPNMTEHDLVSIAENSWLQLGGQAHIRYFISTNMDKPDGMVPRQNATSRAITKDDLIVMEISGAFRGYAGQVLRSMSMRAKPANWVTEFHEVANSALNSIASVLRSGCTMQEILDAASIIEESGLTTCDDLIHGFGGGYLPPILGSKSRPAGDIPDIKLQEGMAIVVQPNITDSTGMRGVQTGALFVISKEGPLCLQKTPVGLLTAKSGFI